MAPFVELGVRATDVTFGHVVADECRRLGVPLAEYVARYDVDAAPPFPGVDGMVARLDRWAVCSNKVRSAGAAELERLGWMPSVALFAEDFGGAAKTLWPVLARLEDLAPGSIVFVGDTSHDRSCAVAAGVTFALAAWNPRAAAIAETDDLVLREPADVLALLAADRAG